MTVEDRPLSVGDRVVWRRYGYPGGIEAAPDYVEAVVLAIYPKSGRVRVLADRGEFYKPLTVLSRLTRRQGHGQ